MIKVPKGMKLIEAVYDVYEWDEKGKPQKVKGVYHEMVTEATAEELTRSDGIAGPSKRALLIKIISDVEELRGRWYVPKYGLKKITVLEEDYV